MILKVRLYGKLGELASNFDEATGKIGLLELEGSSLERVSDALQLLEIDEEEISHIFLNGEYSNKDRKVEDGDRLAIFPRDMALLYKWYFPVKN